MGKSRYVLIDLAHMGHLYRHMAVNLTATIKIQGEMMVVDTSIASGVLKSVFRKGGCGSHFVGVFLEGGAETRKNYFANQRQTVSVGRGGVAEVESKGYKSSRSKEDRSPMYSGMNLAVSLLKEGDAQLYRKKDREADDLIASVVAAIKEVDTMTPIDIYTNDSDLLPLVDEQVSVWIRCKAFTFAEPGLSKQTGYYQVTPQSWDDYVTRPSHLKAYSIPYNSILLKKLIKGDDSDDVVGAVDKYGPKTYNTLVAKMQEDGVDFPGVFRYGVDFDEVIRPVLSAYFEEETVDYMKFIYHGISPMLDAVHLPRRMNVGLMSKSAMQINVNLPLQ